MPEIARLDLTAETDSPDLSRGSVQFIGTATTLIRYGGFTLLTDPNFLHAGDHIHLGYGLLSKRLTNPAMEIDALPPLDACILSHMHADHFDRVAAARLPKDLPIVTTPQAARDVIGKGFRRPYALKTWDSLAASKGGVRLRITSMPGRHGPGALNALLPSVMGSMLDFEAGPARIRIYISGDTLIHEALREIPRRHPEIDLALLHLGGTRILGIMVTMDGRQGVEAMRILRPRKAIPIHYDDYPVFKSPLEDFQRAVKAAGLEDKVAYLRRGETFTFTVRGSEQLVASRAEVGGGGAPG
jgi:L-ascorbate metabolism protein UlaG (beta-lactamase superfamily)